jgi:hypothetical protein
MRNFFLTENKTSVIRDLLGSLLWKKYNFIRIIIFVDVIVVVIVFIVVDFVDVVDVDFVVVDVVEGK